jgi:hypothetical protein
LASAIHLQTHTFRLLRASPAPHLFALFAAVTSLLSIFPPSWLAYLRSPANLPLVIPPTLSSLAVQSITSCLGWPSPLLPPLRLHPPSLPSPPPAPICFLTASLSVRSATVIQLAPSLFSQRSARLSFATCALTVPPLSPPSPPSVTVATANLESAMADLWRIPWDNRYKDTFWRLTVNGVRAMGGHDISFPCACGWCPPPQIPTPLQAMAMRAHCFWDCPVAQAVVSELCHALPASSIISKTHLWLLRSPAVGILPEVWAFVAMTAVHAIYRGRCAMLNAFLDPSRPLPPLDLVRLGSQSACGWFWCLLQDFVDLQSIPRSWGALGPHHPFLHLIPTPPLPGAVVNSPQFSLRLSLPPSLTLPITLDD